MVTIEEISDHNVQDEEIKQNDEDEQEDREDISEISDGEENGEESSQLEEEAFMEDGGYEDDEEVTIVNAASVKPTKGMLKQRKKIEVKKMVSFSEDTVHLEDEGDDLDNKTSKKDQKKTSAKDSDSEGDNLFAKRAIAFFMMFPMIMAALGSASDFFSDLTLDKGLLYMASYFVGGALVIFVVSRLGMFGNLLKAGFFILPLLIAFPSYQVYKCSPVEMKNELLGTWFKLSSSANMIMQKSHETSECFREMRFQAPYQLSILKTNLKITVDLDVIHELHDKETREHMDEQRNIDKNPSLFIISSKRSVKRKYHNLMLIAQSPGKLTQFLREAKKTADRTKYLVSLTGYLSVLPEMMKPVKQDLERMKHNIRPVIFYIKTADYKSRYVKFHHS